MPEAPTFTAADYAAREPEGCGVVGVYNHPDAARLTALALRALQHRGQESAGVASYDGAQIHLRKGQGLVAEVFTTDDLHGLPGSVAIGHVRYSTTGDTIACNAQPLTANYWGGAIAVAHNGNLTNADALATELESNGAIFQSTTDSELLIHLIAQSPDRNFSSALRSSLACLRGAYSMVLLRDDELWAFKDPRGFRPLCIGKLDGGWVVASESCALDVIGAQRVREVAPGELIAFREGQLVSQQPLEARKQALCVFELIYYSRPDSSIDGDNIYEYRLRLGVELAREHPANADVVISVPESGNVAAMGYARAAGIPFEMGLIRSHYVGRTFIEPTQSSRDATARIKYNPVSHVLADKRVVVVDDSVVRGTTIGKITGLLRSAGAREVHFRVSAPPWRHPCVYGIDTPDENELIANRCTIEEMRKLIEADSLGFLSTEGVMRAVPGSLSYCTACFTGDYLEGRPSRKHKNIVKLRVQA